MMKQADYRVPTTGLPNADLAMEYGMSLPCGHGLAAEDVAYVTASIDEFVVSLDRAREARLTR